MTTDSRVEIGSEQMWNEWWLERSRCYTGIKDLLLVFDIQY